MRQEWQILKDTEGSGQGLRKSHPGISLVAQKKSSDGIADLRVEMRIHNLPNNFRNTWQQITANS